MDHLAKGDIQAAYSMGIDDHDLWSKDIYTSYDVPVFQYDCTVDKAAQDCRSPRSHPNEISPKPLKLKS